MQQWNSRLVWWIKEKHYQSGDGSGNESAPATATETEKRK